MLTLNLVSQNLKNDLKLRHLYRLLKKIDFIFIIMSIVIAIMLLSAKIILQNNFNNVVEQTTQITKNSQGYNLKVREINSKITTIEKIQKDFLVWTNLLNELMRIGNDEISYSSIRASSLDKTLKLAGKAKTRGGLIELKEQLEKSKFFSNIDFPITNILEKADVNFAISAKINIDQF